MSIICRIFGHTKKLRKTIVEWEGSFENIVKPYYVYSCERCNLVLKSSIEEGK